jgi:biotin carboxylase
MKQTLLVVAAGPLQLPAIEEAARLSLRTIAVDGSPAAPGMARADVSYAVDIFDSAAVTEIAKKESVTGVMTLCTDAPVRTVAAVAGALGLPALSTSAAALATDKRLMRQALSASGVAVPRYSEVSNLDAALAEAEQLGYPVALKIACSSGSRGVYCIRDSDAIEQYYERARSYQPSGNLLLEEWIEGPEVSVEGICCAGEVQVVQVTDKLLLDGPFPVEAGHVQPSRLSLAVVAKVRAAAIAGIKSLGLTDCAFHAELKVTADGPKIIEIGARLGGDRIATHLTPLSTGVNLVRAAILVALGYTPDLAATRTQGAAIRYFHAPHCGRIETIAGIDELRSLRGLEILYAASERDGPLRPGFMIPEIRSSLDRYGYVLFSGTDAAEALARAEQACQSLHFQFLHSSAALEATT